MAIENTHPIFQERIRKLATLCGMPIDSVYALWREYSDRCYDQSALLWEFVEWYAEKLGGQDVPTLREAVR